MGDEILLVEDNPADVEFTLRALRTHNLDHKVVVARDGAEALDVMLGRTGAGGRRLVPAAALRPALSRDRRG